jgi:tetratricopeptide (TPR) repeat protein
VGCLEENTVHAFAEARLSPDSRAAVEAHARDCSHCQALVAAVALNLPTGTTRRARPGIAASAAIGALTDQGKGNVQASVREPLTPGSSFARYTILGLVGRGGMGEVYAAYDPSLDRRVALKVMSSETGARSARGQERLLREAQVTARLSHPNVVVVHDVGSFEGQMYIAMEFVDGSTLAAWVAEQPRTWQEILGMFTQAAKGLAAAHSEGLVHRDFKPQNVMVSKGGVARVMDFGLARRIGDLEAARGGVLGAHAGDDSLTKTGELLGTPLYMAPEQFDRGRIDARTDQFSFCVALYWALYGVHPFGGRHGRWLARNLVSGHVVAPHKKVAAPPRIQRALVRGLSIDPEARWPSMDALVSELLRDPRRQNVRAGWVVLAGMVAAVVGLTTVHLSRRSRALCAAAPDHLVGVWEPADRAGPSSRREQVRAAVFRAGSVNPTQAWSRISSLLDRYTAKWVAAYRDACEATHVRGEQSEEVLDLRMTCLADNLDSARALTDLVAAGDRDVIDQAPEAATSLEDLTSCSASAQTRSGLRPPRDPSVRRAVEDARKKLKEGNALRQVGQLERARAIAAAVLARTDVASYCPVRVEALLLDGMARPDMWPNESGDGVDQLERVVEEGLRCGHDRAVAAAMGSLVAIEAYGHQPQAERWAKLAASVLQRIGGDPLLESWLANDLGVLRLEQGRWDEGRQEEERAIALKKRALGPDNLDIAGSEANLALLLMMLNRTDEALSAIESALALDRKWMAADSVYLGELLDNEGEVLFARGSFAAAAASFQRAWSILDRKLPREHSARFYPLVGLALVALESGNTGDAISKLERVLSSSYPLRAAPWDVAQVQFNLAVALDRAHRDRSRARELALQSLEGYAAVPALETKRREVLAWLNARRKSL